jgi:hypothetical protein
MKIWMGLVFVEDMPRVRLFGIHQKATALDMLLNRFGH